MSYEKTSDVQRENKRKYERVETYGHSDGSVGKRRTVLKKSRNERKGIEPKTVEEFFSPKFNPKVKSKRVLYKRDGKFYTSHQVGNLGGKEREISEKKYNRLSKKMDRRQKRFKSK